MPEPTAPSSPGRATLLAVIALGGALGALARAAVGSLAAPAPGDLPWPTLTVNVTGCLLIGALMAVVTLRPTGPLLRPFLGVGVLGGYTTFSTASLEAVTRLEAGAGPAAVASVALTVLGALGGVLLGHRLTAAALGTRR